MRILVMDGNSILNRAFYGIKMLSTKTGQMTNAIYGFLLTLEKLKVDVNPEITIIAFDLKGSNFRHKIFTEYKAHRKGMPDELASQIPIIKNLLTEMGYPLVTCEGFEADDILGTFVAYCEKTNNECALASGDRDLLQLVSEKTEVHIASTRFGKAVSTVYDVEKIKEVYDVLPKNLIDIKAIQGDTSDNIPGVKGIGEKGAKELVQKFGSIENIYENIENIDIKKTLKEKLLSGKDDAFLSKTLGTIRKDLPIDLALENYIQKPMNESEVKKILTELEFFSFLKKMNFDSVQKGQIDSEIQKINVVFEKNLKNLIEKIEKVKIFNFLIEFKTSEEILVYVNIESTVYIVFEEKTKILKFFKNIFENKNITANTHDIKKTLTKLGNINLKPNGSFFDTMLASYLIDPSSKDSNFERIITLYGIDLPKIEGNLSFPIKENENLSFFEGEKEETATSETQIKLIKQCSLIIEASKILKSELEKNEQINLLLKIEQPLAIVLSNMEILGFEVDATGLKIMSTEIAEVLEEIRKNIYTLTGTDFNINSPKQLATVLFDVLNLKKGKKTKSGYSTNAKVLEDLRGQHAAVDLILEYRGLSKLRSTYCEGLLKLISKDGRVHSFFNQTETRTGRISSLEPNLQNIPIRTERGRLLRKFFRAKNGCFLVDADYSQIELRVLAHLSGDKNMIAAFKNGNDIHAITASQIMNVPLKDVTSEMRFRAKAVNFGIIYGMGAFSLSKDLKISVYKAQEYINRYLTHYSGVDEFMKNIVEEAKNKGYTETLFKRRRYHPELSSSNHTLRALGERVARNMPIQGTAADIIKIAMINVSNKLKEQKLSSNLILQVHDELIIETPLDEIKTAEILLKNEMENAVKLNVPLNVNISTGKTWFDTK